MLAFPEIAILAAATLALSCVALTKEVASGAPFHCTTAPDAKPLPLTVKVKSGAPGVADVGLNDEMVGRAPIVKVTAGAVVTPLAMTVTFAAPAVVMRDVGTVAVS
jgi:hypothetical protein